MFYPLLSVLFWVLLGGGDFFSLGDIFSMEAREITDEKHQLKEINLFREYINIKTMHYYAFDHHIYVEKGRGMTCQ